MKDQCDWCHHWADIERHHVAQGIHRGVSDEHEELKVSLCIGCHRALHECSAHCRAIGLALIYLAGRGDQVALFHKVTERKFPDEAAVRIWIERLRGRSNR